jgi:hypothetical protein
MTSQLIDQLQALKYKSESEIKSIMEGIGDIGELYISGVITDEDLQLLIKDIFVFLQCKVAIKYICDTLKSEFGFPELRGNETSLFFCADSSMPIKMWLDYYSRILAEKLKSADSADKAPDLLPDLIKAFPLDWVFKYKQVMAENKSSADDIIVFVMRVSEALKDNVAD